MCEGCAVIVKIPVSVLDKGLRCSCECSAREIVCLAALATVLVTTFVMLLATALAMVLEVVGSVESVFANRGS